MQNVQTTNSCDTLHYQHLGPFETFGKINDVTFYLDLPSQMRIHLVFHVNLLEPYSLSFMPIHMVSFPTHVQLVDGQQYQVGGILDSKIM